MLLTDPLTFIAIIVAEIVCISLTFFIQIKTKKNQLKIAFTFLTTMLTIMCTGVILQVTLSKPLQIDPFYFEYFTYIGNVFFPIGILLVGLIFTNTKIEFKRIYLLLFIIPITSLSILWTNDYHHLFYKVYSTNLNNTVTGPYATIHLIYTYGLLFSTVIILLKYSINNSGFFSRQSMLFTFGTLIPVIVNILGALNIIPMSIYITPISLTFTILFWALAIFKFKFISTAPIALQKIVDKISDSYIVLDEDYNITDFNETFLHTFRTKADYIRGKNVFELTTIASNSKISKLLKGAFEKIKDTDETFQFEQEFPEIKKTFTIEMNNIYSKNNFLGTVILFKDITQHKQDIKTIKNNQDILIEQERLASLGQMIGGIAHNLKTPIFSVAGGLEGLSDLVNEFDASIDNDTVTNEDMHAIASDMHEWIEKLKDHISYMSDVITTVKGQAVTLSESESTDFSIPELFKRVDILMKHEVKNALVTLTITNNVGERELLSGNINSLVQIINNIISNAIEAYGKDYTDKKIELAANRQNADIVISIKDYGPGISKMAQEKLFKEMITTKGKNGTGLGMFISYSNIKVHFNGNLTYETEAGKGTTFYIAIPANF